MTSASAVQQITQLPSLRASSACDLDGSVVMLSAPTQAGLLKLAIGGSMLTGICRASELAPCWAEDMECATADWLEAADDSAADSAGEVLAAADS